MRSLTNYRNWLQMVKSSNVTVPKQPRSAKQQEALLKAQAARKANTFSRWLQQEAQAGRTVINPERYISNIQTIAAERHISLRQAHIAVTFAADRDAWFAHLVFEKVDWNELRQVVAEAMGKQYTVDKNGIVRVQGSLTQAEIRSLFTSYDAAPKALVSNQIVNEETGETSIIKLEIIPGHGSDDPDFIRITKN